MSITDLWRGRRRAADRIPVLTTERDLWFMLALLQAHQLGAARRQLDAADASTTVMGAELDGLRIERADITGAYDQLAARYHEVDADLRNLKAISSPAPADHKPAIVLHDLDDTVSTPVSALWDALGQPAAAA